MDSKMRNSFAGVVEIMGAKGTEWGRFTENQMLAASDEDHRKMRDIFAAQITAPGAEPPVHRRGVDHHAVADRSRPGELGEAVGP